MHSLDVRVSQEARAADVAALQHSIAEEKERATGVRATGQLAIRELQKVHASELQALREQVLGLARYR